MSNMRFVVRFIVGLCIGATLAYLPFRSSCLKGKTTTLVQATPVIEVVFALDTTSSMDGLVAGAKKKIWAIANSLASGTPRPKIKFGLVAYRDLGDDYVTKKFALTEDIDQVYSDLMELRTKGGGDGPEHVNQALSEAINDFKWSKSDNVLKLIFLVGDAEPHNDYPNYPTSTELAKLAKSKNIIINTVRCGSDHDTEKSWKEISSMSGGNYLSIEQDGGMEAVATPFDKKLQELNLRLSETMYGSGSVERRRNYHRKAQRRKQFDAEDAGNSAGYFGKTGLMPEGDLLQAVSKGAVSLTDDNALPADVADLSLHERKAWFSSKKKERKALQKEIRRITKKRDGFVKKNAPKSGFDKNVEKTITEQSKRIGVKY